jgi:pyridoxamine 5'-phosphate oxidase
MIQIISLVDEEPYRKFKIFYDEALSCKQKYIEAVLIASFNKYENEVDARYVNLKYINNQEWIFFSNYNSPKATQFNSHNQISAIFHWESINVQIRIKAMIKKTSPEFSDQHFKSRSKEKNALAISSNQSFSANNYDLVLKKYLDVFESENDLINRPDYWGGYTFKPYYFEFWEGHPSRLNKREAYKINESSWNKEILQP